MAQACRLRCRERISSEKLRWRPERTTLSNLDPTTVRTDRGSTAVMFSTAERSVEIATGQMLTLEYDIPHGVEGIVDSSFLLTIAWRIHPLFGSD